MSHDRYVIITVVYEPLLTYGRSLEWIAPELRDAGLTMVEELNGGPSPSRTWAGVVHRPAFNRFADAWRLGGAAEKPVLVVTNEGRQLPGFSHTLDGMNWEAGGASPIVYVCVEVARI